MNTTTEIIQVNPTEFGIEESKATELIGNLPQIKGERQILEQMYEQVILLDIEDKNTSKKAKELRFKIKENRTKGIEVWHKTSKDFFLKGGQFVDAIKRLEIAVNQRMEENLEQIEKHFEIKEAKRKQELSELRIAELELYSEFVPMGINFGELSDEEYLKIFNGSKLQYEAKLEADKKAEEQRIAQEKAEAEAREQQRLENERLKAEAEKREKEIEAERKKQAEILAKQKAEAEKIARAEAEKQAKIQAEKDAELKRERDAKAKLEAELHAKKEAEAKAESERIAEEKRLRLEADKKAKAPIKKQLSIWVDEFTIPEINVENEKKTLIIQKFEAFKKWAKSEIESI